MRDVRRLSNLYDVLLKNHQLVPDWRFGQFIINLLSWHVSKYGNDGFYVEDAEWEKRIKEFLEELHVK